MTNANEKSKRGIGRRLLTKQQRTLGIRWSFRLVFCSPAWFTLLVWEWVDAPEVSAPSWEPEAISRAEGLKGAFAAQLRWRRVDATSWLAKCFAHEWQDKHLHLFVDILVYCHNLLMHPPNTIFFFWKFSWWQVGETILCSFWLCIIYY